MTRSYEAIRVRRSPPSMALKDTGSHRFRAANDLDAVRSAMILHSHSYNPETDHIAVWELVDNKPERYVTIIEGQS